MPNVIIDIHNTIFLGLLALRFVYPLLKQYVRCVPIWYFVSFFSLFFKKLMVLVLLLLTLSSLSLKYNTIKILFTKKK